MSNDKYNTINTTGKKQRNNFYDFTTATPKNYDITSTQQSKRIALNPIQPTSISGRNSRTPNKNDVSITGSQYGYNFTTSFMKPDASTRIQTFRFTSNQKERVI